jgi:hypothetical protein
VNAVDRLTDALVRRAARRWPADVADSLLREWRAELAVIQTQPHTRIGPRIWRQVAFASSLAFSPSNGVDGPASAGWRQMSQWGRAARQFALMLGIALAAMVVARAMNELAFQVLTGNDWQSLPPRSVQGIGTVAAQLLGIVIMTLVGAWLSRRARPALETLRSGAILRAAYFVVPLGVAQYAVHAADRLEELNGIQGYPYQPQAAVAIGAWTMVMMFSVAVSLRLAARGKQAVAWLAAAAGALLAADISGFVAAERAARSLHVALASGPLWFPRSYLPDGIAGLGAQFPSGLLQSLTIGPPANYRLHPLYVVLPLAGDIALPLMLCGGFLVTYVLRRPAASTAPVTAGPHEGSARTPARRWVRIFAGATAVAGLAIWASISALPDYRSLDNLGSAGVSYQERITAILLVALALMLMAPGRARIGAAAIATSMLLLVADGVVGRAEWSGVTVAIAMFGFGAAVALTAFWLSRRFAGAGSDDESGRRTPTIVAVIAAAAIPTDVGISDILANHDFITSQGGGATGVTSPPALFAAVSVGLAVLLVVFALVAAWTGRIAPISLPALTTLVVVACTLLLLGIIDAAAVERALFWPDLRFFVQPMLIVVVLCVQRWRSGSGVRTVALWCLAGVGAAIASVAGSQAMAYVGIVVTTPLLRAVYQGTFRAYDVFGSSNVWSHIVVGIALAVLLARPARNGAPARTSALAASV